ncbi:relaxase/mobilization nuclease domain-containing protein [Sinosporangium siamense]|uniref:MobA/VirD2-like nuclease domain-containing protein n=1 Tax=Sinosporangium siamense TaxID=1367973 RepID=A0A919RM71_9ACTN|nr:hypothetical protein [Sinosporangium siamense]GII96355.1 hypothetical protein Ssi02_65860 [Sinosporangium siamense]
MIGKVLRGAKVSGLLRYLYGPGRANEHIDPRVVAGWREPAEVEPPVRADGSRDFRPLTGLLEQPLAALAGRGHERPVWHCVARAAPGDRILSDAEWAEAARTIMDRSGLAPSGDEEAVRWVAVRHADDHVHIVATLGRQDGVRPSTWNDFYKVREACRELEGRFGLVVTAPGDRTAARRPTKGESEAAVRQGWEEPARIALRRRVQAAAAGAGSTEEFFQALREAGVLVHRRLDEKGHGRVVGYAVALPGHANREGRPVWYGGGKLAADLSLPKLQAQRGWAKPGGGGSGAERVSEVSARVLLGRSVRSAARSATGEEDFFRRLREAGVGVRLRHSERNPLEVTGYAVASVEGDGRWFGGGRLGDDLTLPRLRRLWDGSPRESGGESRERSAEERRELWADAVRLSADYDRRFGGVEPDAVGGLLGVAGDVLGDRRVRRAGEEFDRAVREPYGRVAPPAARSGGVRLAARLLAAAGRGRNGSTVAMMTLVSSLQAMVVAVAELRRAQGRLFQAEAAGRAARELDGVLAGASAGRPRDRQVLLAEGDFPTLGAVVGRSGFRRSAEGRRSVPSHAARPPSRSTF